MIILSLIFQKKTWLRHLKWICLLVVVFSGFYGLYSSKQEMIQGGILGNLTGNIFKNLFGVIGTNLLLFGAVIWILSRIFPNYYEKLYGKISQIKKEPAMETAQNTTMSSGQEFKSASMEQSIANSFSPQQKDPLYEDEGTVETEDEAYCEIQYDEYKKDYPSVSEEDSYYEEEQEYEKESAENYQSAPSYRLQPITPVYIENFVEEKVLSQEPQKIHHYDSRKETDSYTTTVQAPPAEDFHYQPEEEPEPEENTVEDQNISREKTSDEEYQWQERNVIQRPVKHCYHNFQFPPMQLLEDGDKETVESRENVRNAGIQLLNVLREFSIEAKLSNIITGPVVTRYELIPPKGLKINKIVALADNIALGIAAYDKIRIEAPIPGKSAVGIEVPNQQRQLVSFKDLISNEHFKPQKSHLPFTLGKAISGKPYYTDIGKIPHLLIAGSTGSGKSVCVNSLICSILYSKKPDEVRLMLVDPKRVELKMYEELPHLITPVMKETHEAITALNWAVKHMEERYRILESYNVRSISGYNIMRKQENKSTMPYIVIIIDEFADLIMTGRKEIEEPIIRLAQMSRAVGIHLVLATQRPSADVITNLIKANFPGRIAFKVATKLESRIILDINGAETLLGKGDMLYTSPNMSNISRLQSPFISDEEVFRITQFYKKHYKSDYWDEVLEEMQCETEGEAMDPSEEPLFNEAVDIVVREKKASASYLQRRLKIGYNRAARIVEMMEDMGIVGPQSGSKPRDVLIDSW
jgi:S-DNA-T family DNA segregation ATPase FtsK/SpoIIIE